MPIAVQLLEGASIKDVHKIWTPSPLFAHGSDLHYQNQHNLTNYISFGPAPLTLSVQTSFMDDPQAQGEKHVEREISLLSSAPECHRHSPSLFSRFL